MQIAVVGGGSVGMLVAARLSLVHHDIELITRSEEQAKRIQQEQITVETLAGNKIKMSISARAFENTLPPADLYLLTVKQPDLPRILPALQGIPDSARIVAFQNGLGHQEILENTLHPEQIFYAVNTEGARRLSASEVVYTGRGILRIGPLHPLNEKDRLVEKLVQLAGKAGMDAHYVEETSSLLWRKVLANAVINPLTTIFEISNGELLESDVTLGTMRRLFEEAQSVAESQGQIITEADWQDILGICRNTSRNYSSMLQDLWNNKQTEIDSINGYISQLGQSMNSNAPMNEAVRRVIRLKTSLRLQRGVAKDVYH